MFLVHLQHSSVVNIFHIKMFGIEILEKNETHILYPVLLSISSVVFKLIEEEQLGCLFLSLYLCATNIKQLKCAEFKTRTGVSKQLAPYFQSFVIFLYFSICAISAPSINYSYLCQILGKQRY